jgi:hypothetical protein
VTLIDLDRLESADGWIEEHRPFFGQRLANEEGRMKNEEFAFSPFILLPSSFILLPSSFAPASRNPIAKSRFDLASRQRP